MVRSTRVRGRAARPHARLFACHDLARSAPRAETAEACLSRGFRLQAEALRRSAASSARRRRLRSRRAGQALAWSVRLSRSRAERAEGRERGGVSRGFRLPTEGPAASAQEIHDALAG